MSFAKLHEFSSVAVATLDSNGMLIEGNLRFLKLVNRAQEKSGRFQVGHYFIQPDFATLGKMQADDSGEIYRGLLTIGERTGATRTLHARIRRENAHLCLQAEFDVDELEKLNDTVLRLNSDYTQAQFQINRINLQLKQREGELKRSLAELEASNIRLKTTQKQLVEAEKIASLSVMVAGMAHEINTPLGVSLGSASLLEQQSRELSVEFAQRSMTRSQLEGFLSNAMQELQLIRTNLDRIARLTDSFHQLAVSENGSVKTRFNFKNCIDDVIASLGKTLSIHHIRVSVDCDPSLEFDGYLLDWSSIIINLITNSIRHGFTGRNQGKIEIRIAYTSKNLTFDYDDDGAGLSDHVQKHIFDPFFTTDLQQGMGLGMHLIYNLVTGKFHGAISCSNNAAQGAHFSIVVPL